jgi:tetratricopeptide (TPR) repeat protein
LNTQPAPRAAPVRGSHGLDALSVGLVLAFAAVAASFVARNSDVWLHLATGRLLAAGGYRFGADPFAFTTDEVYWANHAWLFDLGLYLTFTQFGGAALVGLKAAAVAATAGLMLLAARGRGPAWVATGCVLLALLALSPRLLLQPAVASLVLLAASLFCLRAGGRALAAVPVLIAVWVNVDAWFVLGPVLVGLFGLGRLFDPERRALSPWPSWFVPAALLASLISPHHLFALRLPLELSPDVLTSAFASDPRFAGVFASPWRWAPLGAAGGYSPAAWAFFGLLFLGPVSFAVNRRAARDWRIAVWLPFALLAAWQARLIPFFAVVAGPITALNLREAWPAGAFHRAGRALVVVVALALLGLGWTGWLGGVNARDRAAAWDVYTDPTLARAAAGVVAWRHTNGVPDPARVFNAHPDVGHYLAWHAPGERYFLDSRLPLFTGVADKYEELSGGLGLLSESVPHWTGGATPVILYDPDGGRMTRALAAVTSNQWEVLRIDGTAVLLAPLGAPGFGPPFDADRAAFGGAGELPTAWDGPASMAEPVAWWRVRGGRGRLGSWEADAALVYLRLAETGSSSSPALALLAVRAARGGIEIDPSDPTAWLALGRAYLLLGGRTWEREAGAGLTPLEQIRLLQATAALAQAVLLNPDLIPAHEFLAQLFLRQNVTDLALRHAAAAARLVRRNGPAAGEPAAAFAERLAQADARAEAVLGSVQDAQNRFLVRTVGTAGEPLARARAAAALGLGQQALDVLLASHPDLYGPAGLELLIELLLKTGQVEECGTFLDRAELRRNPSALGYHDLPRKPNPDGSRWPYRLQAYDWFDLCRCAAAGRYAGAQAAVGRLCDRLQAEERNTAPQLAASATVLFAGDVALGAPPTPVLARLIRVREENVLNGLLAQTRALSVTRADLWTVAGVLDLERGDAPTAAARFALARGLYAAAPAAAVSRPGEPLAARYEAALRTTR